jgi:hypothetical protein
MANRKDKATKRFKEDDGLCKKQAISLTYQKAQDLAEHYNTVMWTLIYIGIGLSLWILYLVWVKRPEISVGLKLVMLLLGSLILFYFSSIIEKSNEKKNRCFKICREIEKEERNNFDCQNKIHSLMENLPISNRMVGGMGFLRAIKFALFFLYLVGSLWLGFSFLGTIRDPFPYFVLVVFCASITFVAMIVELFYWVAK